MNENDTMYERILKRSSIARGFTIQHGEAEELTGRTINPRLLDFEPQGSRMVVLLDEKAKQVGNIVLTEKGQDQMKRATGFILSVGPHAGIRQIAPIGNIEVEHPSHLLGLHILFGMATGKALKTSIYDDDYDTETIQINTNDVWMVDTNARPLQADAEFHAAYQSTKQGQEDEAAKKLEEARKALIETREDAA